MLANQLYISLINIIMPINQTIIPTVSSDVGKIEKINHIKFEIACIRTLHKCTIFKNDQYCSTDSSRYIVQNEKLPLW